MKKTGIVMGSDSDLPVIQKATAVLDALEMPYEVHVYSAHRTPEEAGNFAKTAREKGFGVIIAAAGMAAHLAGQSQRHIALSLSLSGERGAGKDKSAASFCDAGRQQGGAFKTQSGMGGNHP